MITNKDEAMSTIEQETSYWLEDFDEDRADAELQRIMALYSGILEGENEWNNTVELM